MIYGRLLGGVLPSQGSGTPPPKTRLSRVPRQCAPFVRYAPERLRRPSNPCRRQGVCNFEINDFVEIVQKNSEETALFALQNLEISAFFTFQNLEETALFTYNFSEGM